MVDRKIREKADKYPTILELEAKCPRCSANSPLAQFSGSIWEARCPKCYQSFAPEPGNLIRALYARAGLGEIGYTAGKSGNKRR